MGTVDIIVAYISLGIIATLVIVSYKFLFKDKIAIPCFACETDGTMIKCSAGTGAGTATCDRWKDGEKKLKNIIDKGSGLKDTAAEIADTLLAPIRAIEKLVEDVNKLRADIRMNIPTFKPLAIPKVPMIPLEIKFADIPAFTCCPAIETAINASIGAINTAVDFTVGGINDAIKEINKEIVKLGIYKLNSVRVDDIGKIDFTFKIDLAAELAKIGITNWNIGKDMTDTLNVVVDGLNTSFAVSVEGINIAIKAINDAFNIVIDGLADALESLIKSLSDTLSSLNIFKDIVPQISELTGLLKEINPMEFVGFLAYKAFQSIVPVQVLLDYSILAIFIVLIGAFIYAMITLKSVLMPIEQVIVVIKSLIPVIKSFIPGAIGMGIILAILGGLSAIGVIYALFRKAGPFGYLIYKKVEKVKELTPEEQKALQQEAQQQAQNLI